MSEKFYSFKIQTLKNSQDENSPHLLAKFEFLATNKAVAEEYRLSLIEHHKKNKAFPPEMLYSATDLV